MLMLFTNNVLPCGQSSPSNENGRYTAKAVLMIRQSRLQKKIVDTEIENVYSTPKQQNISQSHNEKFR